MSQTVAWCGGNTTHLTEQKLGVLCEWWRRHTEKRHTERKTGFSYRNHSNIISKNRSFNIIKCPINLHIANCLVIVIKNFILFFWTSTQIRTTNCNWPMCILNLNVSVPFPFVGRWSLRNFWRDCSFPSLYFGGCIHSVDTTLCNPYKLSVGSTGLNQYLGLFLAIYGNFHLFLSTWF